MSPFYRALFILIAVWTAGASAGAQAQEPFVAEDLQIPIRLGLNVRATNPPEYEVYVRIDGKVRRLEGVPESYYLSMRHALQNARIHDVLTRGVSEPPPRVRKPTEERFVTASIGSVSSRERKHALDLQAQRAIVRIQRAVVDGESQQFPPLIAERIQNGELDVTRPLTVLQRRGMHENVLTDQGWLSERELEAFTRAHDEWRVREQIRQMQEPAPEEPVSVQVLATRIGKSLQQVSVNGSLPDCM